MSSCPCSPPDSHGGVLIALVLAVLWGSLELFVFLGRRVGGGHNWGVGHWGLGVGACGWPGLAVRAWSVLIRFWKKPVILVLF